MKTLAFLFLASIVLLMAGLMLNEGHSSPRTLNTAPELAEGSTNLVAVVPQKKVIAVTQAVAKPPTKIAPSPLVLAMEADNFCEALIQSSRTSAITKEHAPALLESLNASPALRELYAPDGPIFGSPERISPLTHKLSKLFLALRLANMLYYGPSEKADDARARELFLELEKQEPGNSAFPYFRLVVEKRQGLSQEKLLETAAKAASGSYFDTLLLEHLRELEGARWQSPTHHLVVSQFLSYANNIDLNSGFTAVHDLDRAADSQYGEQIGELMMQNGKRAPRGAGFFEFSANEYDLGRHLAKNSESPDSTMLSREKDGYSPPYSPYVDSNACDRNVYDEFYHSVHLLR